MTLADRVDLVVVGREIEAIRERVNLASLAAAQSLSVIPPVELAAVDLRDLERTGKVLREFQPDLIVNCATFHPYDLVSELPADAQTALAEAGLGIWLPFHLSPALQLMESLASTGVDANVINCAYPDAVNPALDAVGQAPLVGVGNIANNAPAIRRVLADYIGRDPSELDIAMVMHHFVSHRIHRLGDSGGAPFYLAWRPAGSEEDFREVTSLDRSRVLSQLATNFRRSGGTEGRLMPAAATVSVVTALLSPATQHLHAPGPLGQVGGLPISVSREVLTIDVPRPLGLNTAQEINTAGQRHDGIASIDPCGKICLTDHANSALEEIIGASFPSYHVSDVGEIANQLHGCIRRALSQ